MLTETIFKDMYALDYSGNFRIKAFTKNTDAPAEESFITLNVTQEGSSYTVVSDLTGIEDSCRILAAGYKNEKFVTLNHIPFSGDAVTLTLNGDIDTIKVMAWDSTNGAVPLCKSQTITDW